MFGAGATLIGSLKPMRTSVLPRLWRRNAAGISPRILSESGENTTALDIGVDDLNDEGHFSYFWFFCFFAAVGQDYDIITTTSEHQVIIQA